MAKPEAKASAAPPMQSPSRACLHRKAQSERAKEKRQRQAQRRFVGEGEIEEDAGGKQHRDPKDPAVPLRFERAGRSGEDARAETLRAVPRGRDACLSRSPSPRPHMADAQTGQRRVPALPLPRIHPYATSRPPQAPSPASDTAQEAPMSEKVVTRFAPSPTGYLHIGGRAHGAVQLALCASQGRHDAAPHRGHRPGALDRGRDPRHPRRLALARARLGRRAALPAHARRAPSRDRRASARRGQSLSLLRERGGACGHARARPRRRPRARL